MQPCLLFEVSKTRTSPRNPRCNGQTERFKRTLIRMIKAYLKGEQTDWERNLGCLAAAYRASQHESTGLTPNLLMLGPKVRLPSEVMFGSGTMISGEPITSYGEYVDTLCSQMQMAYEIARKHLTSTAQRQKQDYDYKIHLNRYPTGDLVWVLSEKRQLNLTPKLRWPYKGLYLVLKQINDLIWFSLTRRARDR